MCVSTRTVATLINIGTAGAVALHSTVLYLLTTSNARTVHFAKNRTVFALQTSFLAGEEA